MNEKEKQQLNELWSSIKNYKVDEQHVTKLLKDSPDLKKSQLPTNNIWILKPAGLSRGRGIKLFSDLTQIRLFLKTNEMHFVAQKYIERPLLWNRRKFDLRVWVLVTGINPLRIWFYNKFYARRAAEDYDLSNIGDRFRHLTNISVQKQIKNVDTHSLMLSEE